MLLVWGPRDKNAAVIANNLIMINCFKNNVLEPILFKPKLSYSGKEGAVVMMNGYCFS